MKGLITKDILIIRNQWKTLAMILFIGIIMAVTQQPVAIIAYLPIIFGMVILGTFSYDEMDNGYSYLFTLPASRKTYVKEKYLFSFITVIVTVAISIIACIVIMTLSSEPPQIEWNEIFTSAGAIFTFIMILFAVEIPLRLKYGVEKGRITLYVLFGILAIGAILLSRFFSVNMLSHLGTYFQAKSFAILGSIMITSVIVFYLSSLLSTRILKEKEF